MSKEFKAATFKEMASAYLSVFPSYSPPESPLHNISEIQDFCRTSLSILKENKIQFKQSEKNYLKYEQEHRNLLTQIIAISPIYLPNQRAEFTEREEIKNPFSILISQIRVMMLDLQSFAEAFHKFTELTSSAKNFESKVAEYSILLEKIRKGKKSVITTTSIEKVQTNIQEVYNNFVSDQQSVETIISILNSMFLSYLPKIKMTHVLMFSSGMRNFASTSVSEYENLAAYVLQVEESLKI